MPFAEQHRPPEDLQQFKLKSILEITKAINNNQTTSELVGLLKNILQKEKML